MFETSIEQSIFGTAIALWFAHAWYLNTKLRSVHEKLDRVLECFDGLRSYLYEIDPQFNDERTSSKAVWDDQPFAGMDDIALLDRKKEEGRRKTDIEYTFLSTLAHVASVASMSSNRIEVNHTQTPRFHCVSSRLQLPSAQYASLLTLPD